MASCMDFFCGVFPPTCIVINRLLVGTMGKKAFPVHGKKIRDRKKYKTCSRNVLKVINYYITLILRRRYIIKFYDCFR